MNDTIALFHCFLVNHIKYERNSQEKAGNPQPFSSIFSRNSFSLPTALISVKGHTEKNGNFVADEWTVPQQFRFTMKNGGTIDAEADASGMTDVADDVIFTVEVADGVELTFVEYNT